MNKRFKSFLFTVQAWITGVYVYNNGSHFFGLILLLVAGSFLGEFFTAKNSLDGIEVKAMKFSRKNAPPAVRSFIEALEKEAGVDSKCEDPDCKNCKEEEAK